MVAAKMVARIAKERMVIESWVGICSVRQEGWRVWNWGLRTEVVRATSSVVKGEKKCERI